MKKTKPQIINFFLMRLRPTTWLPQLKRLKPISLMMSLTKKTKPQIQNFFDAI